MKDIRHIATSFNGKNVAFAEFEKIVQIVDMEKNNIVSEFETVLDFGGRRIIISENGDICICGCWERHGICGYDVKSGKKIWQRKDLKKVQKMKLMRSDENLFFAYFANKSSELIEIDSGRTIEKLRGVKSFYESKFQPINILEYRDKYNVVDRNTNKKLFGIEKQSFAILDVSFSYDSVLVSEVCRPAACYDISNGKLLWETEKIDGEHFTRLSYNEKINSYIGVSFSYGIAAKKIKYINSKSGDIGNEINIECPAEAVFAFDGKLLITSDKEIIELENGKRRKIK